MSNSKPQDINQILSDVQAKIAVPKGQYNKFGGYYYRSLEDILNVAKPLLKQHGATLLLDDEIIQVGDRFYLKATAKLSVNGETITCTSYAREAEEKKGMDSAQVTGSCSSYARKYALDGLFAIADTADPDALNTHGKNGANKQNNNSQPTQKPQSQNTGQDSGKSSGSKQSGAQDKPTKEQFQKMGALANELFSSKEERLQALNNWLENRGENRVSSGSDLTRDQASAFIEELESMKEVQDQEKKEAENATANQ